MHVGAFNQRPARHRLLRRLLRRRRARRLGGATHLLLRRRRHRRRGRRLGLVRRRARRQVAPGANVPPFETFEADQEICRGQRLLSV